MNAFRFAAFMLALAPAVTVAQTIQVNKENRTIAITTNAEAEALADRAIVTVGFVTYGKAQDTTYADASRTSNSIIDALKAAGVKPDQIQSASQNLTGIDENDKQRFAQGFRFAFTQSWRVTVAAASASETLHVAITAGANDSGSIDWQLANADALEAEAAQKALSHAREIADRMAKGLNARLGPLVYASNQLPPGPFSRFGVLNTESASVTRSKVNLKPLAISPDKISRSATVYAVFAIE